MNDDRLNDCICKLKILSKLEPREKIIIHERTIEIVDYTTYNFARLKKAVKFADKWHMLPKLEAMYHDIDSIVDNLVNNPPNRTPEQDILFALDRLRHDLNGSLQGLYNLIVTYDSDKSAVARLETLYEKVKILSQTINKYFDNKDVEIDRRNYGVENVYEESNKVKQINEFDPNKPELQIKAPRNVPSTMPQVLSQGPTNQQQSANIQDISRQRLSSSNSQSSVLKSPNLILNDNDSDIDDTFSSESPIQDQESIDLRKSKDSVISINDSQALQRIQSTNSQNSEKNAQNSQNVQAVQAAQAAQTIHNLNNLQTLQNILNEQKLKNTRNVQSVQSNGKKNNKRNRRR